MRISRFKTSKMPENVKEINIQLVLEYQRDTDKFKRSKIVGKLLETNQGLMGLLIKKYCPMYSKYELLSMLHDVLHLCAGSFNVDYYRFNNSFITYVMYRFSSNLQKVTHEESTVKYPYHYRNDDDAYSCVSIDEANDIEFSDSYCEKAANELEQIMNEYQKHNEMNQSKKDNFKILKLSLDLGYSEIGLMHNICKERVRQRRNKAIKDLNSFVGSDFRKVI